MFVTHALLSPSRSLYMDICLPVCRGVFRKFLKISSTYIGKFSSLCGGVSANFFEKSSYYNWTLPVRKLTVCTKLFSLRQRSSHYIWTTESKNFVFFRKEISLYYNWKLTGRNLMVCTKLFSLRQRFSHFIWTIEGKNFDVSITYPQYYWKVSIALRGYLDNFFIVLLL